MGIILINSCNIPDIILWKQFCHQLKSIILTLLETKQDDRSKDDNFQSNPLFSKQPHEPSTKICRVLINLVNQIGTSESSGVESNNSLNILDAAKGI